MFTGNSIFSGASINGYGDLFDDVMSKGQELISDPSKAVDTAKGLIPGGSTAPSSPAPQTAPPPPAETSYAMPQAAPPVPVAPAVCPPGFVGTPPNCRRDAYLRSGIIGAGRLAQSAMTGRSSALPPPMPRPAGPVQPGAPVMAQDYPSVPVAPTGPESKALWYVGAAVAVAAIGGIAYWFTTRKSA